MCDICRQYPCHPQCPNADEPEIYAHCDECEAEIYDGDEYYKIGDHKFCESCVQNGHKIAEVAW